jgi:hypothetical protein
MVPCPFCSRPSKKQLRACGVFRKKATVVKGSCLRAAEFENVAVSATGKPQVLPKIRQIRSETFHMIKQAYGEEAWAAVLCLSGTKVLLDQEELPKQQVTLLPHLPCSLDLAPCDFFFFLRLKEKLRGRRFLSAEEIVAATREAVWDLPADSFQQCFQQLYQRWQTCIAANGDCFQGECE